LPPDADRWGAEVFHDLDEALDGCDAVMMLRLQRERMTGAYIPSPREYSALYGMNAERLARAKPGAVVLHPGPMNRGVEIDAEVADMAETSLIQEQVEAGVAVRMAVLSLLTEWAGNGDAR
jgi:aspartate carbamoyltransferase catalytic subunit